MHPDNPRTKFRKQAQEEAKNFIRDTSTDMIGNDSEKILQSRAAYGQAAAKTIVRTKAGFNFEVDTRVLKGAQYLKYASKGFAAADVFFIGKNAYSGAYSGNYGWLVADTAMVGIGTFGGPLGTGVNIMYNVGKSYYNVGVK